MADAKKVKIGGIWYNVKDETARNGLATKQNTLTFDTTPTASSTNPVTSGGVKTALDGKQNTLTFDTTPTANSTNPVTSNGIKSALDAKLNKSGGTMTGGLTINRPKSNSAVITQLNSSSASSLPSSNEIIYSSVTIDKDANWMGQIYSTLYSTGKVSFSIGASNNFTGSYKYNLLDFVIDQNGYPGIGVSSPAAWRNGLGASNGVWPTSVGGTGGTDSGWLSYTNSSAFTGAINYRKVGAFLVISSYYINLTNQLSGNAYVTLGQLPSGYRPTKLIIAPCIVNNHEMTNKSLSVMIWTDGVMQLVSNNEPVKTTYNIGFSGFGFI